MNLVSIIMQLLTPELIGKLASGIGGDKSLVGKAIGALVPSILGSLVGVAAQPNGGSLLTNAISKLDPGLMGNLGSVLGGAGQGALATTGTNILGSLLGNSALGTLAGAVGKFSGLGGTASTGLVGALVPLILGSLGQQQKSMGLDAGGLAKLLGDQKNNINAAMPADFSKLLQGSGLLDGAMGTAAGAMKSASSAASTATGTMSSAAKTATSSATSTASRAATATEGGSNWLYWLLGLVALAAIAWFLAGRGTPTVPTVPAVTTPAMIKVGDLDVTGTFNGALSKLTTALPTIKDEATAKAALPSLTDAQGAFDKVAGVYGQIPADSKPALQGLAKTAIATLGPLVTAALANSAAGPIIKPALDGIMAKLDTMTK